jgi:NADH:ubiquinone reductase (H+-translocating)
MKRMAIVGAGFAGLQAAFRLERLFRKSVEHEVMLIGDVSYFLFTPLLPQVASSYINPRHIVQPVRDIRGGRKFRFLRDTVEGVDLGGRRLALGSGETFDYDYLVLAPGSKTDYFGIPGARENTLDYKTLEDGVTLRERILDLCEHADQSTDTAERARLLTVVVVGGGYTGVELMAELRDFFHQYVLRRFRGIKRSDVRLLILEAGPAILRSVDESLARHAVTRLEAGGVEIRTGAKVTRCVPEGIEIGGSELIQAHTVVWAAGVRAHPLVEALPGPHDRIGRAVVNEHLQLEGHPEVFVAGDSGLPSNVKDTPRIAPVAIRQGALAARNIHHMEHAEKLESFAYEDRGSLVELGMNDAVVTVFGIRFYGYLAWLFWNAIHLLKLVGFKKQVQVAFDWVLGTVFPRDAASVRRPRECGMCGVEERVEAGNGGVRK